MSEPRLLKPNEKPDWLDLLIQEKITVPGQRHSEHHTFACMGENGFFAEVSARILSLQRIEFSYSVSLLFVRQDNLDYETNGERQVSVNRTPTNANDEYAVHRYLADDPDFAAPDQYCPGLDAMRYQRRPDAETLRLCGDVLDFINEKLCRIATVQGIYDEAAATHQMYVDYEEKKYESARAAGDFVSKADIARKIRTLVAEDIRGGIDAPGCVCMYPGRKEEALEWIDAFRSCSSDRLHVPNIETDPKASEYIARAERFHTNGNMEGAFPEDADMEGEFFGEENMEGEFFGEEDMEGEFPEEASDMDCYFAYFDYSPLSDRPMDPDTYQRLNALVRPLEEAILEDRVEAYFEKNYAENKAFIESHFPFRLPEKWNALVK